MTWKPLPLYCFSTSMNHRSSILQGPHHVAQKFNRTAFPRYPESLEFSAVQSGEFKIRSHLANVVHGTKADFRI